ncbi:hypothetical protein BSPWISOX_2931 [uncultured Gammaproteobacteria bacterium]|nr:hypothetical protein BSPWISOX_2931 [uncultured Gammaproteobacteria bacterium]
MLTKSLPLSTQTNLFHAELYNAPLQIELMFKEIRKLLDK